MALNYITRTLKTQSHKASYQQNLYFTLVEELQRFKYFGSFISQVLMFQLSEVIIDLKKLDHRRNTWEKYICLHSFLKVFCFDLLGWKNKDAAETLTFHHQLLLLAVLWALTVLGMAEVPASVGWSHSKLVGESVDGSGIKIIFSDC